MLTTNLKAFGKKGFKALGKDEKGFTLIELLAVIVILGIIAVIAVPLIGNIINKSRTDADVNTASQVYNAARMYVINQNNGDFTNQSVTVTQMQTGNFLDATLVLPSTKKTLNGTDSKVTFDKDGKLVNVILKDSGTSNTTYTAAEVLAAAKASS
ncbi:type II secretion system protein [Paenibacillus sp. WLX1005]|uniref:type II secretion system protein n=1 Tax=Paenibacillus sp. WLX1005 TaxID=3243766 RepID=UPI003984346C